MVLVGTAKVMPPGRSPLEDVSPPEPSNFIGVESMCRRSVIVDSSYILTNLTRGILL